LVGQRIAGFNTVHNHPADLGIIVAMGAPKFEVLFAAIEQQPDISPVAMEMLTLFCQKIDNINARIAKTRRRASCTSDRFAFTSKLDENVIMDGDKSC
jgi:hypothetical protein